MTEWDRLHQELKITLGDWPLVLIPLVVDYTLVRQYEWQIDDKTTADLARDSFRLCSLSKYSLARGPSSWGFQFIFGEGFELFLVGISNLCGMHLAIYLEKKHNNVKITTRGAQLSVHYSEGHVFFITITIDKETSVADFEYGNRTNGSFEMAQTLSIGKALTDWDNVYPSIETVGRLGHSDIAFIHF